MRIIAALVVAVSLIACSGGDDGSQSADGGAKDPAAAVRNLLNAVVAEQLPGPGSVFLETRWAYRAPVRPGGLTCGLGRAFKPRSG